MGSTRAINLVHVTTIVRVTTFHIAGQMRRGYAAAMPAPQRETDRTFQMRVTPEWLTLIDDWRRHQPDIPSRAEAIRRLVALGLKSPQIDQPR